LRLETIGGGNKKKADMKNNPLRYTLFLYIPTQKANRLKRMFVIYNRKT
jgi:hypothetical protein